MLNNEEIIFNAEGNNVPGMPPGDIIFIVRELEHDKFKRQGNNLITTIDIPLAMALTGGSVSYKHINDKNYVITNNTGDIIKCNEIKTVINLGMPIKGLVDEYGNLIINFNIIMPSPNWIDNDSILNIKKYLPTQEVHTGEEISIIDYTPNHDDEINNEEEQPQQQGIPCTQN